MLKTLKFTNFKSWSDANLSCGKITGLFGTNSSGKTSLLQFLLLLKQTKDATDRALALDLNGDYVKLGTIRDAIHNHDENNEISWRIGFQLKHELILRNPSGGVISRSREIALRAQVGVQSMAPRSRDLAYRLGDAKFELKSKKTDERSFDLSASHIRPEQDIGFAFVRTQGRPWQLPPPIKSYAFPDQARTYYQNASFLSDLEATYEAAIDQIYYLGPLREYPQRDYLWARSRPTDVGQRGEKTIDAILAATESGEKRNLRAKAHLMPFQQIIAYWLKEMGLIESFSVVEIAEGSNRWQARVKTRKGASEVLLTDVGFGVSQVLPVVTLLQYVPEGSTVILEQPEIHLHPLAQAGLADVIIQAAIHRSVQVILESHSEHILLRLQRRMAEEKIEADDVKLYFCDAPSGVSKLTPLSVDLYGNITNWPDRFMGDAFSETAEAELARLKRMQRANG
jgi:predicted ATPase